MSTFVKWKFYELIFWKAHFQQLWAHGIVSSQSLVKWVPGPSVQEPSVHDSDASVQLVSEAVDTRAPSQYKDRLIYVWRFPC